MSYNGFQNIALMSVVMGAVSYGVGLIPLSFSLSRTHLSMLSILSTGLLVGTALGVVVPEGVEEVVASDPHRDSYSTKVAVAILLGFAFMLVVEDYFSSRSSSTPSMPQNPRRHPVFDVDLRELEREEGMASGGPSSPPGAAFRTESVHSLSLGLVVHALVDGYVLGVSASDDHSPALSLVVFFAIMVHKAPTALALTSSLLSKSLSIPECKRHLLLFSLATPTSSILSYVLHSFSSVKQRINSGMPLLFSGGTFLYVATALQNASRNTREPLPPAGEITRSTGTGLLLAGMFFPFVVSQALGHGH